MSKKEWIKEIIAGITFEDLIFSLVDIQTVPFSPIMKLLHEEESIKSGQLLEMLFGYKTHYVIEVSREQREFGIKNTLKEICCIVSEDMEDMDIVEAVYYGVKAIREREIMSRFRFGGSQFYLRPSLWRKEAVIVPTNGSATDKIAGGEAKRYAWEK